MYRSDEFWDDEDAPCIVCGAPQSGHDFGCAMREPDTFVVWRDDRGVVVCDTCIEREDEPNSFEPLDGDEAAAFQADCAASSGPVMCERCRNVIRPREES